MQRAHELGEQLLSLAQSEHDPALLVEAHRVQGITLACLGDFALSREHSERGFTFYDPQQHSSLAFSYGQDPGVFCLANAARALWPLGYPEQALKRSHEALSLAQRLSHPFSLSYALFVAVLLHICRGEGHAAQNRAEALLTLSTEQRLLWSVGAGTILGGWALAEQGERAAGIAQMRQGMEALQATGAMSERSHWLALLAEAYGKVRQTEEGLSALVEALNFVDKTGERWWEAELYRLKGELTLQQFKVQGSKLKVEEEAEACFQQALAVARQQQAKSWELRAATSLARLWQQKSKTAEARDLLAPVYDWFTEGFDTADLKDAKALLDTLS